MKCLECFEHDHAPWCRLRLERRIRRTERAGWTYAALNEQYLVPWYSDEFIEVVW